MKIGIGVADNAAPALFLCSKIAKILVYFCPFFAQIKNSKKMRHEGFEPKRQIKSKIIRRKV